MANPILAAILSFILPGIGQIYAGDTQKGIIFIVVAIVLGLIIRLILRQWFGKIIDLAYHIYAAYDAYQLAKY